MCGRMALEGNNNHDSKNSHDSNNSSSNSDRNSSLGTPVVPFFPSLRIVMIVQTVVVLAVIIARGTSSASSRRLWRPRKDEAARFQA